MSHIVFEHPAYFTPADIPWDFGPCCNCGVEGRQVRNVIFLPYESPSPGMGWGCFVCNLPPNGAIAVMCDGCLDAEAPILYACLGRPAEGKGRVPLSEIEHAPFEHELTPHLAEYAQQHLDKKELR